MEGLLPWLKFAACAAMIGVAGPALTRYGDRIARLTGLSRSWIGLLLLATATSLPELFTGLSAVTVADAPDIAVGDALGSCVFNLAMLVVLDMLSRDEPILSRVEQSHALTAGFGVILLGLVGAALLIRRDGLALQILHIGFYTPVFILLYLVAMRASFTYELRHRPVLPASEAVAESGLGRAVAGYFLAAGVVVAAGTWLPFVGLEIAEAMGWQATFVGTLFLAAATSLPELAVTIGALRLGAVDMAVANLLGSNLFDVLVLAIDDLAYAGGPLLASVSPVHAVSAFAAVVMYGIFIVALTYRPQTRFLGMTVWFSLSLLAVYFLSSYAVFLLGR